MPSQKLEGARSQTQAMPQEEMTLEARLKQIYASYQNGQWAQAITQCESVIAHCNQRMSETSVASQPTATVSEETPTVDLYIAKGDLCSRQNKIAEAIEFYGQALSLQPRQSELLKKVGSLYEQQAQKAKIENGAPAAVRVYLQALTQHPRLFSIYNRLQYNLMRYEISAGDPILEEIVQVCQRIVEKEPSILTAQITLGFALTKLSKSDAASACYRRVSEQFTRRQILEAVPNADLGKTVTFSSQSRTPDFLIIGAEKCGTTSLYQYLRQHPNVLPPIEKEIDFFDMEYAQGIDWYLAHFPPSFASHLPNQKQWVTGEISANYLYSDTAPKRVFKHFPNIKLAVILRNPIDRTVSRYNMMVRNGAENRTFETAVTEEIAIIQKAMTQSEDGQTVPWPALNRCRHIGNSLYYYHLKRWLDLFSSEQLLILRSEDLFAQPEQTLAQLYQSFGLTPHSEQSYPKHNSGQYSPAEGTVRQTLSAFFAPHTDKLETLFDRSFDWKT